MWLASSVEINHNKRLQAMVTQGRTGYLSSGHMSKHMLIGGINALPYSSHMPTVHI